MLKRSVFFSVAIFFFSCHSHDAVIKAPSTKEIADAIMGMYREMSAADDGGGYRIDQMEVLDRKPAKEADHYFVKIKAAGIYRHPPLPIQSLMRLIRKRERRS